MSANPTKRWCACPVDHEYEVDGLDHWNPWGDPTFEVTGSLICPTCGLRGHPMTRAADAEHRAINAGFDLLRRVSRPPSG